MQSKGFIKVLTVLLFLVCAFYLSFTFVTRHHEGKAAEYAAAQAGTTDVANDAYKTYYSAYLDSIENQKVFSILIKDYTFKEAREMEVGLGLDLKGGMDVTLQISVPDILKALSNENPDPKFNQAIALTDSLHRNDKDYVAAFCAEYKRIAPEGSLAQIFRNMENVKPGDSNEHVQSILESEVKAMVRNSRNVLATRIDRFGVVSPNIQELESTGRIKLEMPGVKEPERMRKLLQGTANLEFYETYTMQELQQSMMQFAQEMDAANAADTTKASKPVAQLLGWNTGRVGGPIIGCVNVLDTAAVNRLMHSRIAARYLPTNLKACWTVKPIDEKGLYYDLIALKTTQGNPALDGSVITDASSSYEQLQGNVVSMKMNDEGARRWARITEQNLNRSIAIVLDDNVYSYPNVNSVIEGGNSQITGNFTVEEAADLANVLKSGKMVAKVNIVSESVIGPSLGQEAIEAGMLSFVVALIILMVFLVAMYGFGPGMVANVGILLNLFFTVGILASFHAVLTLPGIAGIVLSLAMSVDANVLIYERTKEELRNGKNLKAAVADGYKNAFSAIFDSNLTSIITGIILLINGTGPIKGFATTLIIGLVCSFFTAIYVTRVIIEAIMKRGGFKNVTYTTALSLKALINTNIDFMGNRKKGFIIFGVIIVAFAVLLGVRQLSPGIDFSGGRNYVVQFDHEVSTADIQEQLEPLFPDASVSVITIDNNTKVRISTNYKIDDDTETVDDEIMDILFKGLKPEIGDMTFADFSVANETIGVVSSEKVGPAIAADMTRDASWAVFFSLIAMALYILLRFRNIAFSLGALAAVAFTAYAVVGIYTLYGLFPFEMEIDQNFIAAILTVIGYQVNDTVVVFDRVREYRALYPKQDAFTLFNNSLNSTLSRTLVTGLSSLLVLIVIFILGGETIRSFTFAMVIGIVIGTFASLFIAAPLAFVISNKQEKKAAKEAVAKK